VRGISQARNSEPSVAVLIDGVLQANPSQFNQELIDIENIQILKGPQGALYGRNAIGGAIIINSKAPSDKFEGSVMLGADSGPGYKIRGTVSGPITNTLKYRATVSYFDTDGYIENTFLNKEADPFRDLSGRLRLTWEPIDKLKADFRFYGSKVDTQALYFNITTDVNDVSLPVRVNNHGVNERDMYGVSLKLDYDLGFATVTTVTAYDDLQELLTGDQFNFGIRAIQVLRFGPGTAPVPRRERREPGNPLHLARQSAPALDRGRLWHLDGALHLDRQRVRPRHSHGTGSGTGGETHTVAAVQPAVHLSRGFPGQFRLGAFR
jgi:outer membrane receptor protein involved in Fe transport